jgi:hypothetical protein
MTKQEKIEKRAGQPPWWALPIKNGGHGSRFRRLVPHWLAAVRPVPGRR